MEVTRFGEGRHLGLYFFSGFRTVEKTHHLCNNNNDSVGARRLRRNILDLVRILDIACYNRSALFKTFMVTCRTSLRLDPAWGASEWQRHISDYRRGQVSVNVSERYEVALLYEPAFIDYLPYSWSKPRTANQMSHCPDGDGLKTIIIDDVHWLHKGTNAPWTDFFSFLTTCQLGQPMPRSKVQQSR